MTTGNASAKTLSAPPSLAPLYVRAAVTGRLHTGDTLPDSDYALAEQEIDAGKLAAYQRVCGFRVSDVLPPTYLHVLAFPLSVALMLEPAFPFPLVGLVHVANSTTVARPVHSDELVSLAVRAADLRPHPAGRQLDLLAEASVDDAVVWSARSTYLRREKPTDPRPDKKPAATAEPWDAVSSVLVPENIGRKYAAVSGDRNPIHLHALTAKAFGFPKAIAHGMWLKARTLAALEGRLPDGYTVDVAFKTPVFLPSRVSIAADRSGSGWALDVRSTRSGKPHLAGTIDPA
jgi:acyl dehydratase